MFIESLVTEKIGSLSSPEDGVVGNGSCVYREKVGVSMMTVSCEIDINESPLVILILFLDCISSEES